MKQLSIKLKLDSIMKINLFLLLGIFILSCNPRREDAIGENYDELFKFKGIDRPDISYEDMTAKLCNPDEPLNKYRYPGVEIKNQREYTVTLKCRYTGGSGYVSRYVVKYIGEDKNIYTIGSKNSSEHIAVMEDGEELVKTFKVKSGYPMYLSVNGVGDRNSHIEASIRAVSTDGHIITPVLSTIQYQNREGPNRIESPYCQYIILP